MLRGNVARGLSGIGCAAGDVASDALHIGDVVTGVGGTVASVAVQGALIGCQVAIEIDRARDLMHELEAEVESTGELPAESRLRDYLRPR